MAEENNGLCPTCINSLFCNTYGEIKCLIQKKRIYGYKTMTECKFYKKTPSWFKKGRCQCEDCLKNPNLEVEEAEE